MDSTAYGERRSSSQITLKQLLVAVAARRWKILITCLVLGAVAAAVAWTLPDQYKAAALLAPSTDTASGSSAGALSGLASQFSGLAALSGVSQLGDRKWESITVLESEELTERYIQSNDLLPVLYAKRWDAERRAWRGRPPSLWEANRLFKRSIRNVTVDTRTGVVTMTVTWTDPALAAKWANDIVALTNDYLRQKALDQSQKRIAYLNEEAAKTNLLEARQAIYSVLESEINKAMLARGSDQYAFKILDPAFVPEKPSSLPTALWAVVGVLAGLVISVFVLLFKMAWDAQ